jgi:hypothetical protein
MASFLLYKKEKHMPEDNNNKKEAPQEQTSVANENSNEQEQVIHVHNPFTGKDVDVTQDQLDSIEKQIEAQTERD